MNQATRDAPPMGQGEQMQYSRAGLGGFVLMLNACGANTDASEEAVGNNRTAITDGTKISAAQHGAPDTSVIKIDLNLKTCTAIKVGSKTFWTAAHCTYGTAPGSTVKITNNLTGTFSGSQSYERTIKTIAAHPSYVNTGEMWQFNTAIDILNYDVGQFTLADTTPNIPLYSTVDNSAITAPQSVTYTGYGCDLHSSNGGQKQYAFFSLAYPSEWLAFAPDRLGYIPHNMVSLGNSPMGCSGDSGSPVFRKVGTQWLIIGFTINAPEEGDNSGYTGFARYGNVRNWLQSPGDNQFTAGSTGFIFNGLSGRCISGGGTTVVASERHCSPADQESSTQAWILLASGMSGAFYLQNGASGNCLDFTTTVEDDGQTHLSPIERSCLPTSQSNNTQRWAFDALTPPTVTPQANGLYRRLRNVQANLCAAPYKPSASQSEYSHTVLEPCVDTAPGWRKQAWVLTR